MKIATWNVNSAKARQTHIADWLKRSNPDVACLQEIKCVDDAFPRQDYEDLGYNVAVHGQKTYNGVAILSKHRFDEVDVRLPGDDADEQARYLEVVVSGNGRSLRVASIYLPNGNPVDTDKYPYKLAWMDRLHSRARELLEHEEAFVLAGDYNVLPDDGDVYNPDGWRDDALFKPQTRQRFHAFLNLGLTEAFRACNHQSNLYTFWDYQGGAWAKDHGLRIDHLLLSPQAADRLTACRIDRYTRGWERPSDHVPIWVELDL